MKTIIKSVLTVLLFSSMQASALTLVHYWNFNGKNIPYLTERSSKDVVASPLTPISADSSLTTIIQADTVVTGTKASLIYQAIPGTTTTKSYWDLLGLGTGSTLNARNGDGAGDCLRCRDAWTFMQLVLNIPSTGFHDMKIMYDVHRSGSGPNVHTYSYSVDGGVNWIKNGLSVNGKGLGTDTIASIPISFTQTESITITDALADNNPNLKFKILFSDPTNKAGNDRFDNITVEGTSKTTAVENTIQEKTISFYPNPCSTGIVYFAEKVNIVLYDIIGKPVKTVVNTNSLITSDLAKGIYMLHFEGAATQKLIIE